MAVLAVLAVMLSGSVPAAPVALTNATATYTQSGFSIAQTIDGATTGNGGWALAGNLGAASIAVYETAVNAGFAQGSLLTFEFYHSYGFSLNVGRFRLSVTTDPYGSFAAGSGNWTVLDPVSFSSAGGATLAKQVDGSILASGTNPAKDLCLVAANTTLTNITGVRLEAMPDASLPANGPGRYETSGNFVLTEFTTAVWPTNSGSLSRGNFIVKPVTAQASSAWSGLQTAVKTIDGSGLAYDLITGNPIPMFYPSHVSSLPYTTMWLTADYAPLPTPGTITFDLGAVYNLSGFHLWNYNEVGSTDYRSRSISNAVALVSTTGPIDGEGYTTVPLAASRIEMAGSDPYYGDDYAFASSVRARFVRIVAQSNWSATDTHIGMSEIRFITTPPSGTVIMMK